MKGDKVLFRKGYKASLWNAYTVQLASPDLIGHTVEHRLFRLTPDGWLTIHEDYPSDLASGPTIDTPSSIRGAFVHDALYEMMRLGLLPQSCFHAANVELYRILLEDGMWGWRTKLWLWTLDRAGYAAAKPREEPIQTAP